MLLKYSFLTGNLTQRGSVNKYYSLLLLFFSFAASAQKFYVGTSGGFGFVSSEVESKSSLLGPQFTLTPGLRLDYVGIELYIKSGNYSKGHLGSSSSYESTIQYNAYGGQARVFLSDIFSFKAGAVVKKYEMELKKGSKDLDDEEFNDSEFGFLVGMGINNQLIEGIDLFFESSFITGYESEIYIIDADVGVRMYFY